MSERFSPATHEWFSHAFNAPTPAQVGAWAGLAEGEHVLVVAPTGSGKTLAAFLASIDRLLHEPFDGAQGAEGRRRGTRVLYISPLKALAVDVERNLRSPLVGITQAAARRGEAFNEVTVGVRSGDTTQQERRRLITHPPDILITTPESLLLMLTSSARETLREVDTVIVDYIHAVAGTKRGAHLALSLERLDALSARPARRVGLSATVRPHDEVARFLGGRAPVRIVAPETQSLLTLDLAVPVDDMTDLAAPTESGDSPTRSIWPHVEHDLLERVLRVRSTIVFCNSRGLAERLTSRLNEAWAERESTVLTAGSRAPAQLMGGSAQSKGAEPVLARSHHGSVSKEQRELIENDLKSGRLRCVVATSSLELGIDMGAVDLVVQVSTPPSVASGLQRVGRAGHQVGEVSRGVLYPTSRHDLVGAAVTAERMRNGLIERLVVPANPLDVLAQQTVAASALEPLDVESWFDVVRRSAPFATLPRSAFDATLDLLAGRYPSDEFAELRPRVVWDRDAGTITGRPGAQRLAVTSGGTIPDRGMFAVTIAEGSDSANDAKRSGSRRVGELDEEMVYESRVNDVFALGATSWRIQEITHDRVIVTPAFGEPARLPFWKGDTVGRPFELGAAIGEFMRRIDAGETPAVLDPRASANLLSFLAEQRAATGLVPTDRTLVVERFRDELGDWRVVLLSPFGRRVHAPWALAVSARITEQFGIDGSVVASDDGIVARFPDTGADPPGADLFVFDPEELDEIVTAEVGGSALFAARFRECAARALLLPRRNPGARSPLWQQRQRSAQLLQVARNYPDFPILLETARECLQDVYDVPALVELSRRIAGRQVQLAEVVTERASPFAQTLLFGYVASFLYEGDAPLAERRAAALTLDPTLLAELLGRAELRELLDPDVIARTEAELQRLADDRRVTGIEGVADLLRLLGPLATTDVQSRLSEGDAGALLEQLRDSRRAIEVSVAGDVQWAAIEDAGRLRDALGVALPLGIAEAHLSTVDDPLGDLLSRFARTHGPFTAAEAAERFGIGVAVATDGLRRLARDGRLTEGEFRPQATGTEWLEPGVLRRLRSRSLAAARKEIEPVDPATLARFLPAWQGVGGGSRGVEGVLAVVDQLAGKSLPASAWETLVLPSRVADYAPGMLDELLGAGEIVWTGAGSLPGRDGWVQLHPADLVLPALRDAAEPDELGAAILQTLHGGGAFLFRQICDALHEPDHTLVADALWQLVWAGRVAGDTFAPVRAMLSNRGAHTTSARSPRARLRSGRVRTPSLRSGQLGPPTVTGRWFELEAVESDPTKLQLARTEALLARYGVVTRGSVMAEQTPGGFAATYRVLRELEQAGACLRGYFVDTLGGAQFASPTTVDRLRTLQRDDDSEAPAVPAMVLAATDPANPFGAALPWPEVVDPDGESRHRPARKAGALVVIHDGCAVLYLERGGRTVLILSDNPARLAPAAAALAALVQDGRVPRLSVETVAGRPVGSTALGDALRAAGFREHPKGLRLDARR
jgi:ATP-dependent Lhr-like helicase